MSSGGALKEEHDRTSAQSTTSSARNSPRHSLYGQADTSASGQSADFEDIAKDLIANVEVKTRTLHFKKFEKCFLGCDAVRALMARNYASTREDAINLGTALMEAGHFQQVPPTDLHELKDAQVFYRFAVHSDFHGGVGKRNDGTVYKWADIMLGGTTLLREAYGTGSMPRNDTSKWGISVNNLQLSPLDHHNLTLLDHARPPRWVDPKPRAKYNMVVIGAGAGGLVAASGCAQLGGKVALVEANLMGGDFQNFADVPSKALQRCARAAYEARNLGQFGVEAGPVRVNFDAVMDRMRALRAHLAPTNSAVRFSKEFGIDVFKGHARFTSPNTIEVNGKVLSFSTAVIATGGSPAIPPIKGLSEFNYLTHATLFNLQVLPRRLAIVGTGPVALELGQAMARLGSQVTILGRGGRILAKEDYKAAELVQERMTADGVRFMLNVEYQRLTHGPAGEVLIHITNEATGEQQVVDVDKLLVAAGHKPNIDGLNLKAAGIESDPVNGVLVNDQLQTSNKHVYAVGDCCTAYRFTHAADFMARLVVRNALFYSSAKFSQLLIPWCTYTDPEVAHVGLYEHDLVRKKIKYNVWERQLHHVDRAIIDGHEDGFVKVYTKQGSDTILGATIVGHDAGSLISEVTLAMQAGVGLGALAHVIHPYPTMADSIRQTGDLFNNDRQTSFVKSLFRNFLALRR